MRCGTLDFAAANPATYADTLPEHSAFLDALGSFRSLCRRHGRPLSVMMLDLDRFRECNERHSPAFGDYVLRWFASTLKSACRGSDIVARYQGDRFIAAMPDSTASDATQLAQRCVQATRTNALRVAGRPYEITVSIGIAECTAGFIEAEHQLIQRARVALDHAKRLGGGRTVTWTDLLDVQPSRRDMGTLTIDDVSHWVERFRQHLRSTYVESTRALVAAVEAKDPYTRAHSLTVAGYAEGIGKRMQLPARLVNTLRAAALLHDVGKIGLPDAILTKPGPLTDAEFDIVKLHPEKALEILGHVSFLADERPLILHHHEHYDGSGYPAGLAGDRIPIGARILAAADALDTMFSARSYKGPFTIDRVQAELDNCAGQQFDPAVASAALQWLDEAPDSFPLAAASVNA
jgi:diguanylate cyclase (GGDEF)-like protein